MNNKVIGIIVVVLVIIGAIYLFTKPTSQTASYTGKGEVVATISDAALNLDTLSEVNLTVSSLEVHNVMGWTAVAGTPHTYNLLDLNAKNETKVFADFTIATGTYDMVRLSVDSVIIKSKTGTTTVAKLPSGVLKINTKLVVNDSATSTINFEFLADHSLHMTGNGGYIFAPVVKTTTHSDTTVKIESDSSVKIFDGNVDSDEKEGMDIDGEVKDDFEIDANEKLDVENDVIKVHATSTLKVINNL